jgi:predicted ATPase
MFDDVLGIADPNAPLLAIDPDARRRRLTALVNAASLARESPAVYVVEDAHWIDEVSESMLAEFLTVIPQTPSLVLITYRPEYRGALSRVAGAQTIALAPLSDPEIATLIAELLGPDPSVGALGRTIAAKAAGNPFFAEEIVRELSERGVLRGWVAHTSRRRRLLRSVCLPRCRRPSPHASIGSTRKRNARLAPPRWSAPGLASTC